MKRSEILDEIWNILMDMNEHGEYPNYNKASKQILDKLEELGMRPTEQDSILLKRHVVYWDKE